MGNQKKVLYREITGLYWSASVFAVSKKLKVLNQKLNKK
jgi:hypothetical protein